MGRWLETYKPAASKRSHLLLGCSIWTVVGTILLVVGIVWIRRDGGHSAVLIAAAVLVGAVKGLLVLNRSAGHIARRIQQRGDGKCLGGFVSWKQWLLIGAMATTGRILRGSLVPVVVVGFIYAAVGAALLLASTTLWRAWLHEDRARPIGPGSYHDR